MSTDKDRILAAFKKFDVDNNGLISRSELTTLLVALKPSVFSDEKKVDALLKEIDKNGDGSIDYSEFVAWVMGGSSLAKGALEVRSTTHKDPAAYIFTLIDRNEDSKIDEEEFSAWTELVVGDQPDLEEYLDFETIDADESGDIDKEEWKAFMMSLHEKHGEKVAELIYAAGTLAGKVLSLKAEFADAPEEAIRAALDKKMGSTTSAAEWLRFCQKRGKWDVEEENEEDEEED